MYPYNYDRYSIQHYKKKTVINILIYTTMPKPLHAEEDTGECDAYERGSHEGKKREESVMQMREVVMKERGGCRV